MSEKQTFLPTATATVVVDSSTGKWRDGICNIFSHCCKPVCLKTWCCSTCLLGQVMSRVGLDTTANPTSPDVAKKTCCRIVAIIFACFVTMEILDSTFPKKIVCVGENGNDDFFEEHERCHSVFKNEFVTLFVNLFQLLVSIYFIIIACKTRKYIREKNQIPGNDCEDLVCAWCCNCCTIGQMARHTADYDTEVDECFTFDGLQKKPPEAEAVQIMAWATLVVKPGDAVSFNKCMSDNPFYSIYYEGIILYETAAVCHSVKRYCLFHLLFGYNSLICSDYV